MKMVTVWLCIVALSSFVCAGFQGVKAASSVKSEVYGSTWEQISQEITYQSNICSYVNSKFIYAGYDSYNNCGTSTTLSNMMYNINYDQTHYDQVSVFYFGHMRGSSNISATDNSIITTANVRTQANGYPDKHRFVWLWACNTANDIYWEPSTSWMANAWANRTYTNTNLDGYINPNTSVPDCFIGFDGASPCLSYPIFNTTTVLGHQFIEAFYSEALLGCYSVKDSLNRASWTLFNTAYDNCSLYSGYDTYWPADGLNYTGYMKVYGNPNIKLHYEIITAMARDNYGNSVYTSFFMNGSSLAIQAR